MIFPFFVRPEDQRKADEEWLAARGGVYPRPYGFYLWVSMSGSIYLLFRISVGLPAIIAPILEFVVVRTILVILSITSILVLTCWFGRIAANRGIVRTPYWVLRYGEDKHRNLSAPVGAMLLPFAIEAVFGVLYLLEWLYSLIT
ncbi:MAG: hypothetical protein AB1483_12395 [Candidatus Zixiibacteriota bacterium]